MVVVVIIVAVVVFVVVYVEGWTDMNIGMVRLLPGMDSIAIASR